MPESIATGCWANARQPKRRTRSTEPELVLRAFSIDVSTCSLCGGLRERTHDLHRRLGRAAKILGSLRTVDRATAARTRSCGS